MRWNAIGAAVLLIGTGSGSAQPPPPFAPVPPPRQEFVPPHPHGGRLIWQPGHWRWDGFRYAWVGGDYIERWPHYSPYVEGRWLWAPQEGRWIWRPAHWE
jgi:hypothetical protein